MRRRDMIGIFLIVLSLAFFGLCIWFEIGVEPAGDGTTLEKSSGDFQIGVRILEADSIAWYVWIPLSLIGLIGLACLIWPPRR